MQEFLKHQEAVIRKDHNLYFCNKSEVCITFGMTYKPANHKPAVISIYNTSVYVQHDEDLHLDAAATPSIHHLG